MFQIRPFTPIDEEYARIVEINNTLWPDDLMCVEDLKDEDEQRNPQRFFRRLIIELATPVAAAEERGQIIGEAYCGEEHWRYDPGRYFVGFRVDPLSLLTMKKIIQWFKLMSSWGLNPGQAGLNFTRGFKGCSC